VKPALRPLYTLVYVHRIIARIAVTLQDIIRLTSRAGAETLDPIAAGYFSDIETNLTMIHITLTQTAHDIKTELDIVREELKQIEEQVKLGPVTEELKREIEDRIKTLTDRLYHILAYAHENLHDTQDILGQVREYILILRAKTREAKTLRHAIRIELHLITLARQLRELKTFIEKRVRERS